MRTQKLFQIAVLLLLVNVVTLPVRATNPFHPTAGAQPTSDQPTSDQPTSDQATSGQATSATGDNILRFTLLHTNDEHAALVPTPQSEDRLPGAQTTGGIARVATIINTIRQQKSAENEPVVVVSAGDFISGSPFSWLVLRDEAPELQLMLEIGYDVITLGNHEFDYGPTRLASYLTRAGYPASGEQTPIVATNTVIPDAHPLHTAGIREFYIKTLPNGLRVGFFGLMGKHADTVAPMAEPVTFSDQHEAARQTVRTLQDAGAQVIVLLSHSGEQEDADLARAVPGIHVIVGGHTHTVLHEPIIEGKTIIVQTGTEFNYVGNLELAFDPADASVTLRNRENYLLAVTQDTPEDERIAAILAGYSDRLGTLVSEMTRGLITTFNQTIARSPVTLVRTPALAETPLGNFVTDAMRLSVAEATGRPVDFVFEASGVIRGDLRPGQHPQNPGAISFYDMASVIGLGSGPDELPGYPMVSVYFTGEEVRRILEITILLSQVMGNTYYLQNSGLRVEYDPARAIWFNIPFKGTPFPSGRAVLRAERYTGEGIPVPDSDQWEPLERGDQTLYHVVSDLYNASFLPMVGEVLPSFKLVMKDENGNPVELADRIVYRDNAEFKVWQAVTEHVLRQAPGNDQLPVIDSAYANTQGRMLQVDGPPLIPWKGIVFVGVILAAVVVLIRRRTR